MNRRKLSFILIAALILSLVLAGGAMAADSGSGTQTAPYIVNSTKTATITSGSLTNGTYSVAIENLGSVSSGSYQSGTNSYAVVSSSDNVVTASYLVLRNGQYIDLNTNLGGTSEINAGTLTVNATGNTVHGTSQTGSVLNANASTMAYGTFASLNGTVALAAGTTVYGGSASISGNGQALTVNGGTFSVSGSFASVTVNSGSVTVVGNTDTASLAINGGGSVTVKSGNTLCVAGESVKGGSNDISFTVAQPWKTLQQGTYGSIVGTWALAGDVTVKSTTCAVVSSHKDAVIITNGNDLTVEGGTVSTYGTTGDLSVTGGTLKITEDTTADSVNINGGAIVVSEGKSLADGVRTIAPDATAAQSISLTSWGVLPTGTHTATLEGAWSLPSGATVTATAASLAESATVMGVGGTLTVNSDYISVAGGFDALTVNNGFKATIAGDTDVAGAFSLSTSGEALISVGKTLCDSTRSVGPESNATITSWGELPAGTYSNLTGSWSTEAGVTINGTSCTCDAGHNHGTKATITSGAGALNVTGGYVILDGAVGGTVTVSGNGLVENKHDGNTVVNNGGGTVGTGSTEVASGANAATITGTFANVSGTNITLASNPGVTTIINGTGDGYAVITGNGQALTVNDGDVRVKGSFSSITTAEGVHVTLAGNTVILAGNVGVIGADSTAYTLTLGEVNAADSALTAHIAGNFKQITVNSGVVNDCDHEILASRPSVNITNTTTCLFVNGGVVTLDNGGAFKSTSASAVDAVQVTGGKLTLGTGADRTESNIFYIYAESTSGTNGNKGISISGSGECWLLDGVVDVANANASGIYVIGTDAKFHLGTETNKKAYDNLNTPTIITRANDSSGVFVTSGGEAWLHAGEIYFMGKNSYGINVQTGTGNTAGICHVWANDQYGVNAVGTAPLLYIHGGYEAVAAMWVSDSAKFDIRGRGVLLEEPDDHSATQYALYIESTAVGASDYPLSGGAFNGKVRYRAKDISTLIAPNHYLRYDGAEANYGYTDGTYGVRPHTLTDEPYLLGTVTEMHDYTTESVVGFDGAYKEYFGKTGEYYTITDAEWELRRQMAVENGSYQIPAGIVQNPGLIILDWNVFGPNETTYASPYTPYWGMGKQQADVDVTGTGHTLYLAGRIVVYVGRNWSGNITGVLNNLTTAFLLSDGSDDKRQTIDVNSGAALSIRDSVYGGDGTDLDESDHTGGYIGTGTVAYELAENENVTRAIDVDGTLNVYSAQIQAPLGAKSVGIYTNDGSAVNIGMTTEDNDNQLIDIRGGAGTGGESQALYMDGGSVSVNGGVIGNVDVQHNEFGGSIGIKNCAGTLNVYGGIITGNKGDGVGVMSSGTGTGYIYGGCIYGDWADDTAMAGNGDSIVVESGNVFLKIDEAHKNYAEAVIPLEGTGAYKTCDKHHVNNVTVTGGSFYMGAAEDITNADAAATGAITGYTRNNGVLLCTGGKTVIYDGVTYGATTVQGLKNTSAQSTKFTTGFYIYGGDFGALTVENCADSAHKGYYTIHGLAGELSDCVQLHGGTFQSIDVSELTTGASNVHGAKVVDILGFWDNTYDMDDSGSLDWVRFNHYATVDAAARNERGSWTVSRGDVHVDVDVVAENAVSASKTAGAVTVRDGTDEFITWATSNANSYDGLYGTTFNLHCNIWLGNDVQMCDSYFECDRLTDAELPVTIGSGAHRLDTNNFGIFGDCASALLLVPENYALNITNTETADQAVYSNLICNFDDTVDYINDIYSEGIDVYGELTLGVADGNTNTVTVKAYYNAIYMETGKTTVNAGSVIGKGYYNAGAYGDDYPDGSAGIEMSGGVLDVNGGSILGWGYGITAPGGKINISDALIVGGNAAQASYTSSDHGCEGIYFGGVELTIEDSTVWGYENGVLFNGDGKLTVTDSDVTGKTVDGIQVGPNAGGATVTDSDCAGYCSGMSYFAAGKLTISGGSFTGVTEHGAFLGAGDYVCEFSNASFTGNSSNSGAEGIDTRCASLKLTNCTVSGHDGISVEDSAAKLTIISGTVTGSEVLYPKAVHTGGKGVYIRNADTVTVSGGTISNIDQRAGNVIVSGSPDIQEYNQNGGSVTVSGTPYIEYFTKGASAGKTSLGGGVYSEILTLVDNETLSDIITVAVKDNADVSSRKVTASSVEIVDYVLENNSYLETNAYDTDGDAETPQQSYTAPFILMYTAPQGGGVAPAPKTEQITLVDNKGETSTGVIETEENDDGDVEVKATVTKDELTDAGADGIMTAAIREADGTLRHIPTVVTIDKNGNAVATFTVPADAEFVLVGDKKSFADAKGKWYEDAVNEMASRLILDGRSDDVFDGEADITRAEFAAMVVRALGLAEDGDGSVFTDVGSGKWYFGAVGKAYECGLIDGRGNGIFDPNANITRQEAMAIIARAAEIAKFTGKSGAISSFTDADAVSTWALDAAKFNVGSGLVIGDNGLLRPDDNISRAESATVVLRLLQKAKLVDVRAEV